MLHRSKKVLAVVGLLLLCASHASSQVREDWRQAVFSNRLARDARNHLLIDGTSPDPDLSASKYDTEGNLLWSASFGEPAVVEHANWIAVDSQGDVIVTGHKHGANGGLFTVKFSGTGTVLWSDVQNVASGEAYRVEVGPSDEVYVLGTTFDAHDGFDFYLVKYDRDGNVQWTAQKTFVTGSTDSPRALAVSADGSRIAATGGVGSNDFGTVVYDSAGNEVFEAVYLDGRGGADDVVFGPDGSISVCGSTVSTAGVVVRYDPLGNLLFELEVTSPHSTWGRMKRMTFDKSGNLLAVGGGLGAASSFMDWLVAKIDPLGNLLWVQTHGTFDTWDEWALAVTTGPRDEVYVAGDAGAPGCSLGTRGIGTVVIRYAQDGSVDWIHEADCSGSTTSTVLLDSFGEVVVDPGIGGGPMIRLLQEEWTTLGFALAGTLGDPVLDAQGYLAPDETLTVELSNARPSSRGWHVLGLSRWNVPLAGGVLVPAWDLAVPFQLDAAGRTATSARLPPSVPRPLELTLQSWILDPGAVQGLAASDAVTKALQQ